MSVCTGRPSNDHNLSIMQLLFRIVEKKLLFLYKQLEPVRIRLHSLWISLPPEMCLSPYHFWQLQPQLPA